MIDYDGFKVAWFDYLSGVNACRRTKPVDKRKLRRHLHTITKFQRFDDYSGNTAHRYHEPTAHEESSRLGQCLVVPI